MNNTPTNEELIKLAVEVLNPKQISDNLVGDVGAALVTDKGTVYRGVCLDVASGLGFCAERTAISQMLTNKEYKVAKIVAVWNNNDKKDVYVLPPCGSCRQFMITLCEDAANIDVIIAVDKVVKLKDLLPYSDWPEKPVQ